MTQTKFCANPKKCPTCADPVKIHDIDAVNPECMMVAIAAGEKYDEDNFGTNIAIAAVTTTYARFKLIGMMEKLGE